jgi:hypothetical protein
MKRVLLKCHAQCAASGDAASSSCTMACAQRHLHGTGAAGAGAAAGAGRAGAAAGAAGAGRANLTTAPRLMASRAGPSPRSPALGESAEDEDERDIVFMSRSSKRR